MIRGHHQRNSGTSPRRGTVTPSSPPSSPPRSEQRGCRRVVARATTLATPVPTQQHQPPQPPQYEDLEQQQQQIQLLESSNRFNLMQLQRASINVLRMASCEGVEWLHRLHIYNSYRLQRELLLEAQYLHTMEGILRRGIQKIYQDEKRVLMLFFEGLPTERELLAAIITGSISPQTALAVMAYHKKEEEEMSGVINNNRTVLKPTDHQLRRNTTSTTTPSSSLTFWEMVMEEEKRADRRQQRLDEEMMEEFNQYMQLRSLQNTNGNNKSTDEEFQYFFENYYSKRDNGVNGGIKRPFKVSQAIDRHLQKDSATGRPIPHADQRRAILRRQHLQLQAEALLGSMATAADHNSNRSPRRPTSSSMIRRSSGAAASRSRPSSSASSSPQHHSRRPSSSSSCAFPKSIDTRIGNNNNRSCRQGSSVLTVGQLESIFMPSVPPSERNGWRPVPPSAPPLTTPLPSPNKQQHHQGNTSITSGRRPSSSTSYHHNHHGGVSTSTRTIPATTTTKNLSTPPYDGDDDELVGIPDGDGNSRPTSAATTANLSGVSTIAAIRSRPQSAAISVDFGRSGKPSFSSSNHRRRSTNTSTASGAAQQHRPSSVTSHPSQHSPHHPPTTAYERGTGRQREVPYFTTHYNDGGMGSFLSFEVGYSNSGHGGESSLFSLSSPFEQLAPPTHPYFMKRRDLLDDQLLYHANESSKSSRNKQKQNGYNNANNMDIPPLFEFLLARSLEVEQQQEEVRVARAAAASHASLVARRELEAAFLSFQIWIHVQLQHRAAAVSPFHTTTLSPAPIKHTSTPNSGVAVDDEMAAIVEAFFDGNNVRNPLLPANTSYFLEVNTNWMHFWYECNLASKPPPSLSSLGGGGDVMVDMASTLQYSGRHRRAALLLEYQQQQQQKHHHKNGGGVDVVLTPGSNGWRDRLLIMCAGSSSNNQGDDDEGTNNVVGVYDDGIVENKRRKMMAWLHTWYSNNGTPTTR